MADDVILGIHSNVRNGAIDPETCKPVDPLSTTVTVGCP